MPADGRWDLTWRLKGLIYPLRTTSKVRPLTGDAEFPEKFFLILYPLSVLTFFFYSRHKSSPDTNLPTTYTEVTDRQ